MIALLQQQYELVLGSRNTLMDYLRTIENVDLLTEKSSFGRGSIRNLLAHICDTYASWISERALKKEITYLPPSNFNNLGDCLGYFKVIDNLMDEFIAKFSSNFSSPIEILRNGELIPISPLQLFTHVITHEFHHKGQIMSLSRHLNYTPVDADIIR